MFSIVRNTMPILVVIYQGRRFALVSRFAGPPFRVDFACTSVDASGLFAELFPASANFGDSPSQALNNRN